MRDIADGSPCVMFYVFYFFACDFVKYPNGEEPTRGTSSSDRHCVRTSAQGVRADAQPVCKDAQGG